MLKFVWITIALISHASKVMLKILQARLQQYVYCELPDVQAGLEKAEESEIILPTSVRASKKQQSSRKNLLLLYWLQRSVEHFDCADHNKLENALRDGNTRPPDLPPEKSVSGQEVTELDMEQWTDCKSGEE